MGMLYSILIGVVMLLLMLLIRRKKYQISVGKVFAILIVVTIFTVLGANLGSFLGGMSFWGLRLYGILLVDSIILFGLARLFKMDVGKMGDYLSASIIAVCCIVKVPCMIDGCCYGKEIFVNATGDIVRFPSQVVEFSVWALLTIWLCLIDHKGEHKNLLWAIATIWFGFLRFLVDFMRGNPREMQLMILGLPGGRFWSLFVMIIGILFLLYSLHKYYQQKVILRDMLKVIVGLKIPSEIK